MAKKDKRTKALEAMERALREIASVNEYPPPPGYYAAIKVTWRRMVRSAKKAVALLDEANETALKD